MSHLLDPAQLLQQAMASVSVIAAEAGLHGKLRALVPGKKTPLVMMYSEAEAVISLGQICAKRYNQSLCESFVDFLPLLESFSFHGIKPQHDLTQLYIHRYFTSLSLLISTQPRCRPKIESVLSAYLQSAFDGMYTTLVAQTKGRNAGANAFQRICVLKEISKQRVLSQGDAEFLLGKVTSLYLHSKLLPCKLTNVHLYIMRLLENVLWTGENLLETRNSDVSEVFEVALALIKKFTKKKHHSEKLVRSSVCTVFCCLSSKGVEDIGLHYVRASKKSGNIALRSVSHNSGLEFFIDYFISKQFTQDKYVDLGRKLLKEEIPYVARYLKYYPERKSEFLSFLHGLHVDLVTKWGIRTDKIEELLANATTTLIMDELSTTNDFNNSLALPYFHEQALVSLDLIPYTITSILVEIVHRNTVQTIETQIVNSVLSRLEQVDDKAVYIEFVQSLLRVVKFEETFKSLMQLLLREFRKDPVLSAVAGNPHSDSDIEDLMPRFPAISFSLLLNFIVEVMLELVRSLISPEKVKGKANTVESIVSGQINNAIVFMVETKADLRKIDGRLLGRLRLFWEIVVFFLVRFKPGVIGSTYIKQLGEVTPLLLDPKSASSSLHLNTCAVFSSQSFQDAFSTLARDKLQSLLRGLSVSNMECEEMMFCLAVNTILINKEKPLEACLEYLEDESLLKTRSIFEVIKQLVVACIEQYIQTLGSKVKNESREASIVSDLTLLLKRACSKVALVRQVAQELLCLYISRRHLGVSSGMSLKTCYSYLFPYLLGNLHVVQVALDLLGCLHMELNRQYDSLVHTATLPHSKDTISFPANREEKLEIMEFLRNSLSEMIGKAISINMTEVMTSFAQYTFTSNELLKAAQQREDSQMVSTITNYGISFFNQVHYSLKLALEQSRVDLRMAYFDPIAFHTWFESNIANVQSGGLNSIGIGSQPANTGLAALLPNENQMTIMNINYFTTVSSNPHTDLLESVSPQEAFQVLENELFDAIIATEVIERRECDIAISAAFDRMKSSTIVSNSKLFDVLGKLAMLYIMEQRSGSTKSLAVAQLNTLVWAGILNMSYTSVAATIYCWDLICSSVPSSSEIVFLEILNVWRYISYRGGIVVPGSISAPWPSLRQASNLLTSKGFRELNSHYESTQCSFMFPRDSVETGVAFQPVKMKHLLEIQEGILDFVGKRYYPFLARNNQSLKYLVRMLFETVSQPLNTAAIREKRGMQVCLKLFLLIAQVLTTYSSAGDSELPTYSLFRDRTLKFMLKVFSSSYTWRHVGHRAKLESELALLQQARNICLNEEIDAMFKLGRYTVKVRPRPATTDIEHSGCNLLYLRKDGGISVDTGKLVPLVSSRVDSFAGQLGVDIPAGSGKELKIMRILLHLLLSDEYERLYTWNRPTFSDIISAATSV